MTLTNYLPSNILERYEVHNFRHAAEVLATGCTDELTELMTALGSFRLTVSDIVTKGGNESQIPKKSSGSASVRKLVRNQDQR